MNPFVEINAISKSFQKNLPPALKDISASIPAGKMVGLAGPDGAGKTTLIRLIAGLLLPSAGSIKVGGFNSIQDAASIHSFIGYMPQKFGLYEDLTVIQNLKLYANLRGVLGEERKTAFEKLLSFTSLKPFVNRLAGALSGGMKQKLGLACALIQKPKLLLLDEPSVGVDPLSRRELWQMVQNLLNEGISVLWSTAYLDEAEKCDSVILLNAGKLLYNGAPVGLTKEVQGRVFKISNIQGNRRTILTKALQQPEIMDGVIQGKDIRIVAKKGVQYPFHFPFLKDEKELIIEPIPPRFEDAFIDILGGGPGGWSELAEKTPYVASKKTHVIEANQLVKKFGNFTAADHITFEVKAGEIFGLLGPNGAGKSTTFKMMCGLLKPTSGNAFIEGYNLQEASSVARSHIGYMAQKFSLYGNLSVLQNLEFFSGVYNLKGKHRREMIDQMIHIFGLNPFLNESADDLPLGFKQRLALSCSLMHHPEVIFLDEPTSGVDPITRREFWNHINGLVEKGITIMVTTHFMDEAEYCDRIGLVYRSKLITIGTPDDLKEQAKTVNNPSPTLEDAFIALIQNYEQKTEV